jgi:hypothetical protein
MQSLFTELFSWLNCWFRGHVELEPVLAIRLSGLQAKKKAARARYLAKAARSQSSIGGLSALI